MCVCVCVCVCVCGMGGGGRHNYYRFVFSDGEVGVWGGFGG